MAGNRTPIPILLQRIPDRILSEWEQCELLKRTHNKASVIIQKWVRGFITRRHLAFLHGCATIIQRYFRGFKTRMHVALIAKLKYEEMKKHFYNAKATVIQAAWRGYIGRKIFNYYKYKKWLKHILETNDNISQKLRDFEKDELAYKEKEMVHEYNIWIEYMATKLHHLIRTKVCPGVYSNLNTTSLSEIETYLNKFEFGEFMKELKTERIRNSMGEIFEQSKDPKKINNCLNSIIMKRCIETLKARFALSNPAL